MKRKRKILRLNRKRIVPYDEDFIRETQMILLEWKIEMGECDG